MKKNIFLMSLVLISLISLTILIFVDLKNIILIIPVVFLGITHSSCMYNKIKSKKENKTFEKNGYHIFLNVIMQYTLIFYILYIIVQNIQFLMDSPGIVSITSTISAFISLLIISYFITKGTCF